MSVVQYNN